MSSIVTEQGIFHYETYGQGKPVIFLHGWTSSWGIWQPIMEGLGNQYRTYALDFWGFGESGKTHSTYTIQDFVQMVAQFMEQLGIESAPLIGHSMGGTVSLMTAIQYPQYVKKVGVVGSPITGDSLNIFLQLAGYRPLAAVAHRSTLLKRMFVRRFAPKNWYANHIRDVSRTTLDSFLYSIASLRETNLVPSLHRILVPTLGIYGQFDNVVNPNQNRLLQAGVPHAQIEVFDKSKHFPMFDETEKCLQIIQSFLAFT